MNVRLIKMPLWSWSLDMSLFVIAGCFWELPWPWKLKCQILVLFFLPNKNQSLVLNHYSFSGWFLFSRSFPFIYDFPLLWQYEGVISKPTETNSFFFPLLTSSRSVHLCSQLLPLPFQALFHFLLSKWPPPRRLLSFLPSNGNQGNP